jgi:hypothetical protein
MVRVRVRVRVRLRVRVRVRLWLGLGLGLGLQHYVIQFVNERSVLFSVYFGFLHQ